MRLYVQTELFEAFDAEEWRIGVCLLVRKSHLLSRMISYARIDAEPPELTWTSNVDLIKSVAMHSDI